MVFTATALISVNQLIGIWKLVIQFCILWLGESGMAKLVAIVIMSMNKMIALRCKKIAVQL